MVPDPVNARNGESTAPRSSLVPWGWLTLVVILFTLAVLAHSHSQGRLQYPVDYEDVITFIDGLERYRDLVERGVKKFLEGYVSKPPHAPLHSAMASAGFALFGPVDWVPYAMNGLLIYGLLALLFLLVAPGPMAPGNGKLSAFQSGFAPWAGVAFLLSMPLAYHMVGEFRPDYPSALATVWGMAFFFGFLSSGRSAFAWASGILYGVAILSKPTVLPYILAMGGGPFFWGLIEGLWSGGRKGMLSILRKSWPFFAGCALVATPHLAVAAPKLWAYFILNQFGEHAEIWAFAGGWAERLTYPVTGYGGWLSLGRAWPLVLLLWGASIIATWMARGPWANPEIRRTSAQACAMTLWAYFFLIINSHMNPFFGLTFQILLLLTVANFLVQLCRIPVRKIFDFIFPAMVAGLLLICIAVAFRWPVRKSEFTLGDPSHRAFLQAAPGLVLSRILEGGIGPRHETGVLLTHYGVVNPHTLQWMSDKNRSGLRFFALPYGEAESLVGIFKEQLESKIEWVVALESGMIGEHGFLPSGKTTDAMAGYFAQRDDFVELPPIPAPDGKQIRIFHKREGHP